MICILALLYPLVTAIKPSDVKMAMAKAQENLVAVGDTGVSNPDERTQSSNEATKAEQSVGTAVEKFEAGLMSEKLLEGAKLQAEQFAKLDIRHEKGLVTQAKEKNKELTDEAKLLNTPDYNDDTAAAEAADFLDAVTRGTEAAATKAEVAEEQAERSVMHAKEVTSEENTRAAKGTEELEAQLKAAQGAENREEESKIQSKIDAFNAEAQNALKAEKEAETELHQVEAANKGIQKESDETNTILSKEKALVNQINTLQKEVSSQSYKIRALQLEKRLAQENRFHDTLEVTMKDRVNDAMTSAGLDEDSVFW